MTFRWLAVLMLTTALRGQEPPRTRNRDQRAVAGAGVLTPAGEGRFPAVVLVHGSGPQDRGGAEGPNKTLRDLAEGLASRGIAVLRYDKRTLVFAAKMAGMNGLTLREETVDAAVAAAAMLRSHAAIDPASTISPDSRGDRHFGQ